MNSLGTLPTASVAPFKVTIPAPSNFVPTGFKPGVTDRFYKDRDALLADLVGIVRDEIQWLIAQGVTYIQLDAPFYSHYLDPAHRKAMQMSGTNPDAEFESAVASDNATFAGLSRPGVTMAVHICRGNSRSRCTPKAATTRSPRSSSRASRWIASSSSTTPAGQARLNHSGSSHEAKTWCSG
jgi:5-methyltetrahydropteroyltriglutamate--homocysteine methyltransferase